MEAQPSVHESSALLQGKRSDLAGKGGTPRMRWRIQFVILYSWQCAKEREHVCQICTKELFLEEREGERGRRERTQCRKGRSDRKCLSSPTLNTEEEEGLVSACGAGPHRGQTQETMVIKECFTSELLESGSAFKQGIKGLLTAWLAQLWDMRVDDISLSAVEAEELMKPLPPPSRQQNLQQHTGNQSLMDRLI